jgi:hypothetical protein
MQRQNLKFVIEQSIHVDDMMSVAWNQLLHTTIHIIDMMNT